MDALVAMPSDNLKTSTHKSCDRIEHNITPGLVMLGCCNVNFIRHDFCNEDAEFVLSLPLGHRAHVDRWVWHFNVKVCRVKSGCHLALELIRMREPAALILKQYVHACWKRIWTLKVPEKLELKNTLL